MSVRSSLEDTIILWKDMFGAELVEGLINALSVCILPKYPDINFKALNEEDASKYFEELYNAFNNFIKENPIFKNDAYKIKAYESKVEITKALDEGRDSNIWDYYFESDGKRYSLNIIDDLDETGYNPKYFNFPKDIVICELYQYRHSYNMYDERISSTFAYDKKQKKCICILDINRYSYPYLNPNIIREIQDEQAFERVLKRVTENTDKK